MLKKLKYYLGLVGLFFLPGASYGAIANNAAAVDGEVNAVIGFAEGIFDAIVPVVLAVVALGILLRFAKLIKAR